MRCSRVSFGMLWTADWAACPALMILAATAWYALAASPAAAW